MGRTLRELWDGTEATIGGWCSIPSPFSAEMMGRSGFDWVCIDTQHGVIGYDQMMPMLQALSITATPAFVRVPWNQPDHIMKALDAGAQGVIVPMVSTEEDAKAAVAAAKYPPVGMRSWGPIRAALDVFEVEPLAPESPLRKMENVFLTPHVAGGSEQARANLLEATAANIRRVLAGEEPLNVVNGL